MIPRRHGGRAASSEAHAVAAAVKQLVPVRDVEQASLLKILLLDGLRGTDWRK
jgi:hypothetical protein